MRIAYFGKVFKKDSISISVNVIVWEINNEYSSEKIKFVFK